MDKKTFSDQIDWLMSLHDQTFIREAYRFVLSRSPDDEGQNYYLNRLRQGESKERILKRLGRSAEGKLRGVHSDVLNSALLRRRLAKASIIGPFLDKILPKRLPQSFSTSSSIITTSPSADTADLASPRELPQLRDIVEGLGSALRGLESALQRHESQIIVTMSRSEHLNHDMELTSREMKEISYKLDNLREFLDKFKGKVEQKLELTDLRTHNLERKLHWVSVDNDNIRDRIEFIRKETMFELRKNLSNQTALSSISPQNGTKSDTEGLFSDNTYRRLNLGCGGLALEGYVNIDMRDLPGVDFVSDIRNLPFDKNSIDEIRAAHVIEHFPEHYFIDSLLPHWMSLLRPGGELVLIAPNAKKMIELFSEGMIEWPDVKEVIMGGQEYDGDFHFAMLEPKDVEVMLKQAGFTQIDIREISRKSGLCFEFEIVATK